MKDAELAKSRINTFSNGKAKSSIGKAPDSRGPMRTGMYAAGTGDEGQRSIWTFGEAVKDDKQLKLQTTLFRTAKQKAP
jgi:hypothetical protein